jgi:hypothetical protein
VVLLVSAAMATPVAECARTFDERELHASLDATEAGWVEQEPERFSAARDQVRLQLQCLADPLAPSLMARLHRAEALSAWLAKDRDRATAALAGVFSAEPTHAFPPHLVPPGHPLLELIPGAKALAEKPGRAQFRTLSMGWIEVDGAYRDSMPTERATLLQYVDTSGHVVETRYAWPGDQPRDWLFDARQPLLVAQPGKPGAPAPRGQGIGAGKAVLVGGAGAAAVATGVLAFLASTSHDRALDPTVPLPEAEDSKDQANALTWGYIGTSVATVGLAAAIVLTW